MGECQKGEHSQQNKKKKQQKKKQKQWAVCLYFVRPNAKANGFGYRFSDAFCQFVSLGFVDFFSYFFQQ